MAHPFPARRPRVKGGARSGQGAAHHATTQDMLDSSTWIRDGQGWHCVMHTETPAVASPGH